MKVLITGGGGQVGQALSDSAPEGWQVSALTRAELDITDPAATRATIDEFAPAVVINAAAYTAVDRAESEAEEANRINAEAVSNIVQICASRSTRLVHFSTDFVFDGARSSPYQTDDPTAPQSVYGKSKLAGEVAALAQPQNMVIRTAWVYGIHRANFVMTMLRLMAERNEVRIVADQVGTPTHTHSLARATWSLVEREVRGIHHFTDAGVASWYDFAAAIQEEALELCLLDRKVPVLPVTTTDYPTLAQRPSYSVLDKTQTWNVLDTPAEHWRVELRHMLSALKGKMNG